MAFALRAVVQPASARKIKGGPSCSARSSSIRSSAPSFRWKRPLRDETGKSVHAGRLFRQEAGRAPVLHYYECPMLTRTRSSSSSLVRNLEKRPRCRSAAPRADVVVVSIEPGRNFRPRPPPKRGRVRGRCDRLGAPSVGWRFLSWRWAPREARACGDARFKYELATRRATWAAPHPAGMYDCDPRRGRMQRRYVYGVDYHRDVPKRFRWSLIKPFRQMKPDLARLSTEILLMCFRTIRPRGGTRLRDHEHRPAGWGWSCFSGLVDVRGHEPQARTCRGYIARPRARTGSVDFPLTGRP